MSRCVICSNAIPATAHPQLKVCSEECRQERARRNHTRKLQRARDRRAAASAATRPNCAECGCTPVPVGRSRYCGDECAALATAEAARRRTAARFDEACRSCGKQKDRRGRGVKLCTACKRKSEQRAADVRREVQRRYRERGALDQPEPTDLELVEQVEGTKWCKRCAEFRELGEFPVRKDSRKPATYCRPCQSAYNTERRLRLMFGMTWDDYELLLVCQDYRCAICRGRPRKNILAVDHDHKTGEIRGLLCSRCNHRLLGSANDDPQRLRAAADYLESFRPRDVFGRPRFVPGKGGQP